MFSLDTETTGIDLHHGAEPYFVTTCAEDGTQRWWEWDVDPVTRRVKYLGQDLAQIRAMIRRAAAKDDGRLVLQNSKFDVAALSRTPGWDTVIDWPWDRTEDTLIAGHLLASNQPHNLTDMAVHYLGIDILPLEQKLEKATQEARRLARARFSGKVTTDPFTGKAVMHKPWRIAAKDSPDMPSAKEKTWKLDTWLPRALAKELGYDGDHEWWGVLRDYANADSAVTLMLWKAQEAEMKRLGLWEIYQVRRKLPKIAWEMEQRGVTASLDRAEEMEAGFAEASEDASGRCLAVAEELGCDLVLPKSGNNKSLLSFVYGPLGCPVLKRSEKTGEPSFDKAVVDELERRLPAEGRAGRFLRALAGKRGVDTALNYLEGYKRFWLPNGDGDTCLIHPQINPTGTGTLRWSHFNPNSANVSKQERFNLRRVFGPAPGREWWCADAENIELRIPAFEAGEEELIEVFSHPERPPYFGSYHLVIAELLHPKLFAEHGKAFKTKFSDTWYQWVKNGDFAIIYGAQEETADRAYHVRGAYQKIRRRFPKIAQLADRMIRFAEKHGYVETIPNRMSGAKRGYPLLCTRTEWGRVLPTTPLNYHVSGTAMDWMGNGMIRCEEQLEEWRADGFDAWMVLQVHDELVFDLPKGRGPEPWRTNLPKARRLQRLMEEGGEDIGVPTPVALKYHAENWSSGVAV